TTSPEAVAQLLRHGYIQAPRSIHAEIGKVRPGTLVELASGREPVEHVYWSAREAAERGLADPIVGTDDEIADALDAVLRPVVRDEMVADVPLGAFLSGGIDSSLIVALMQAQSARPVRTFTIGFDDPLFDESQVAAAVAAHLGTEHTELRVDGHDALALVPSLATIYDEPMADSSQLPTLLVSRLTRQHVTVAVSGDGGDELFGGYIQYRQRGSIARLRSLVPSPLRGVAGASLGAVPFPGPTWLATAADRVAKRPLSAATRLGAMLAADDEREVYLALMAQTATPDRLTGPRVDGAFARAALAGPWLDGVDPLTARMLFDAVSYLPDDILVKVDRAAMAYSLETRAPLLDHRVFEFAWRVPFAAKVRDGIGKLPLRRLLTRHVPSALIDRPKRGFAVPLADWLRGPLREWADDLLHADVVRTSDVLDAAAVQALWRQHLEETADHAALLWSLLALCGHLRHEHDSRPATATR
ncbi:MAG: asparagine synthase C-terminal domain-containing protein, partial [Gemmatimonadaceae bacterium]|nr:asparagine synthase C-terminal domain-containing protein [Gemmatimonadaceae bacterium]